MCLEYEQSGQIIKNKTIYKNVKIGNWLSDNIMLFKKGTLPRERIYKLNGLRTWNERIARSERSVKLEWNEKLGLCIEFEQSGQIIKNKTIYKDVNIGTWLGNNLQYFKKGTLPQERIDKLTTLRTWNDRITRSETSDPKFKLEWNEKLALCVEF